jgi:two-component system response regulator HydG
MSFILILEDDITFSLMLSTWLRKKNVQVNCVATVIDAKQKIETERYDLILSDLRLPDGDGIDLLRWLRMQNLSIPFIMMTSYAEIQTAVQSRKVGASEYIAKPLNPEELLRKINEFVQKKRTRFLVAGSHRGEVCRHSANVSACTIGCANGYVGLDYGFEWYG